MVGHDPTGYLELIHICTNLQNIHVCYGLRDLRGEGYPTYTASRQLTPLGRLKFSPLAFVCNLSHRHCMYTVGTVTTTV